MSACGKEPSQPNVVFILADDLGWKDLGCMGSSYYETPHIDSLAAEGMMFTNAYANAPNCAPTRACLMSGQYMPRHGIYTVGSSARGKSRDRKLIPVENTTVLDSGIVTLAESLHQAGYVTALMGKWHLGDEPDHSPLDQGFDINIGGDHNGHPKTYFSPYENPYLNDGPEGEYLTDRLTDEAVRFIESKRDAPFFLYLPHFAVHTPIQAKEALIAKYREKSGNSGQDNPVYAAMIESLDEGVGRILACLDRNGLTENTIVVFYSDNGGHGVMTSMQPLRGSKGMLYEGGIRVPLIVRWPGRIEASAVTDTPVISIDFYPTLLDLCGVSPPVGQTLDGVSLAPILTEGGTIEREALYWHFPAYLEAYKKGEGPWRTTPAGAVRKGNWKLIEFFEDNRVELYNLDNDIGEQNDLSKQRLDTCMELLNDLVNWRQETNAPVPFEMNPEYDPSGN